MGDRLGTPGAVDCFVPVELGQFWLVDPSLRLDDRLVGQESLAKQDPTMGGLGKNFQNLGKTC